jgi:uncharacterized membrane protein YgcG
MQKKGLFIAILVSFFCIVGILATYFNSNFDWQDDFDDGYINQTLFENKTFSCGADSNDFNVLKEEGGDYLTMEGLGIAGAGVFVIEWTGLKVKKNLNDGGEYHVNFSLDVINIQNDQLTINIINQSDNFSFIVDPSCQTDLTSEGGVSERGNSHTIHRFNNTNGKDGAYSMIINSSSTFLFNATGGIVNSSGINKEGDWYLVFENFVDVSNQAIDGNISLLNLSLYGTSGIITNLVAPAHKTQLNSDFASFNTSFTMSQDAHNVTNATFYIYNVSGGLVYSEIIVFQPSNHTEWNLTYTVDSYGNYTWNYLGFGTDGTDLFSDWGTNRTIIFNDTKNPSLSVLEPTGTISSTSFNVTLNVSDKSGLSYCYFNITRGASLEVDNTEINVNDKTMNTSVSGEATYTLKTWCNDSEGYYNLTSQAFTVSIGGGSSSGGGSAGGGGGFSLPEVIETASTPLPNEVCNSRKDLFDYAWEKWKEEQTLDNFILIWYSIWDYSICNSGASIVPLDSMV